MRSYPEIRRANFEALLDIVPGGMFTLDGRMRIRTMNREAERMLGLSPGEALGRTCEDVLESHICAPDCALQNTALDHRSRTDQVLEITRKDGTPLSLVLSTAFLDAPDGEEPEVAVALRDVTEAETLRRAIRDPWVFHGLITASPSMKEIVTLVREMAPYDSTVLVLGESGTGKELVARAVHGESNRRDRPFITVNCSAYSEGLLESELFGHARGAFTGATRDRRGRFEIASGGTIFLDEIGEISPSIQVKLLRVLQEREVERVGDETPISVDIRVIAATNRDLRARVREGLFREDLFYRLNVITFHIPPLRDRPEDIPALVDHLLSRFGEETGKDVRAVSGEAMEALLRHDWPGNVRELQNVLEHAVIRARGPVILRGDLPHDIRGASPHRARHPDDLRAEIEAALQAAGGRVGRAAEILGVHRTTLWRRMQKWGTAPGHHPRPE